MDDGCFSSSGMAWLAHSWPAQAHKAVKQQLKNDLDQEKQLTLGPKNTEE